MRVAVGVMLFLAAAMAMSAGVALAGASYPDTQLAALRDFYANTNGGGWVNETGWSDPNNDSPCGNHSSPLWYGLRCSGSIVTTISLSKNGLGGLLPASLGELIYVQYLDLSANSLIGSIPLSISNMTTLQQLNFDGNGLSGVVPDGLFSNMYSLELLYLASNNLIGPLPDVSQCSSLRYLELASNHFSGSVPDYYGSGLSLSLLDVGLNALTGMFPISICASSTILTCGAYGNQLSCPNQECSKCDLPTCNCEMNACLSPADCAAGLCSSCVASPTGISFCQ